MHSNMNQHDITDYSVLKYVFIDKEEMEIFMSVRDLGFVMDKIILAMNEFRLRVFSNVNYSLI